MQDTLTQNAIQPFIKLAQSNMDLFTRMLPTPQALSASMSDIEKIFRLQAVGMPSHFGNVNLFGQMAQCMVHNHVVCLMEMGRYATAAMSQGQGTLMRTAEDANDAMTHGARRYQQHGARP